MAALREVVARGVTRNARLNPRSVSGEIIPTTLNASALRDADGAVNGAIGILRDMRAYELVVGDLEESRRKLDAANRAKDEFLATLSHELRTPLNAILGWVRLLRSGTLDAAGASRGPEVIERNTRLLAQLIEDLLDVSRIITGKLRLDVGSIEFVHKRIVSERDRGVAVLIVSSELDEIYALADRIAVMYEGKIVAFRPPSVPVEELGLLMAGAGGDGEPGDHAEAAEETEDAAVGRSDPSEPIAGPL